MKKLLSILKRALGILDHLERRTYLGERPRPNLK
jgi:hypothetical protein